MITPPAHPVDDLAVYALDGLDGAELRDLEVHLAGCVRCQQELGMYREMLAKLVVEESPPPQVWTTISGALKPGPSRPPVAIPATGRRWWMRTGAFAVAAAAAVVLVLVTFTVGRSRGGPVSSVEDLAATALTDSQSRVGSLQDPEGADVARVVTADGVGFVYLDSLPALDDGSVYQLWHLDGTGPVSLGVTDRESGVLAVAVPAGVRRLALTMEATGGVTAPTGPVLARGTLPDAS